MKRSIQLLVFALFLLISLLVRGNSPSLEARPQPGGAGTDPCRGAVVSPDLPHEVNLMGDGKLGAAQNDFDCFSWQSLVALNWAAGAKNGEPASDISFGHTGRDGLVVWMTYKQPEEIFLPDGASPCSCDTADPECRERCWNTTKALPDACDSQGTAAKMALMPGVATLRGHVGAVPNVWLTDQNGELVRSEVRLNQDLFDFIATKKYYDSRKQRDDPAAFILPTGETGGAVGTMTLKAAWRIVRSEEESRFFTVDAAILDTKVNQCNGYPDSAGAYPTCNQAGEGPCCVRRMGLVGFHIAHKVKGQRQWVWSTFEHADNAPTQGQPAEPGRKYSFFNPACGTGPRCVPNQNPRKAKIPLGIPVQIERVPLVIQAPAAVNNQWHALVRGTVWENYVLVSTQWLPSPLGPEPPFLANTTIEPYIQVPSSCIGCHSVAYGMNQQTSDFSYLFSKAQPRFGELP